MKQGPKIPTFAIVMTIVFVSLFSVSYFTNIGTTTTLSEYASSSGALYKDAISSTPKFDATNGDNDRNGKYPEYNYGSVTIDAPLGKIKAMVSDTDEKRELGLSGHEPLLADQGMLFVFKNPDSYGFWMKDMKFSIDIVWIDHSHEIVAVNSGVSPDTYPELFFPPSPISYVLELNAGSAEEFGLVVGEKVAFEM